MTSLGSGPISFSTLKTRYVADGDADASGNASLVDKNITHIQFRIYTSRWLDYAKAF